jgi:small nuclear ribonucleoprotein
LSSSQNQQSNILQGSLRKNILLKLKGKKTIKGKLKNFDQYMNLTLENSIEVLEKGETKEMGEIFIKGENIIIIAID